MIGIIVLNIGAIKMIVKVWWNFIFGEGVRRCKIRASAAKGYTSTIICYQKHSRPHPLVHTRMILIPYANDSHSIRE